MSFQFARVLNTKQIYIKYWNCTKFRREEILTRDAGSASVPLTPENTSRITNRTLLSTITRSRQLATFLNILLGYNSQSLKY